MRPIEAAIRPIRDDIEIGSFIPRKRPDDRSGHRAERHTEMSVTECVDHISMAW